MFVFQLDYPNMMEGLMLLNINPCAEGWMDWAAHKVTHALIKGLFKALKYRRTEARNTLEFK